MAKTIPILSPEGERIELSEWVIIKLAQAKFLKRDKETGLQKIERRIYGFLHLFSGRDPTRPSPVRAKDYSQPKRSSSQHPLAGAFSESDIREYHRKLEGA
jgi:hypothetical protein